jgi:hypothetical protein
MCATFRIVYLGDGKTDFRLERTALTDRGGPYDLGECEYHLAMAAEDLAVAHKRREGMGLVCPKNEKMAFILSGTRTDTGLTHDGAAGYNGAAFRGDGLSCRAALSPPVLRRFPFGGDTERRMNRPGCAAGGWLQSRPGLKRMPGIVVV